MAGNTVELTDRLVRFETLRRYPDVHVWWDSREDEEPDVPSMVTITEEDLPSVTRVVVPPPLPHVILQLPSLQPQPTPVCPRRNPSPDTPSRETSP